MFVAEEASAVALLSVVVSMVAVGVMLAGEDAFALPGDRWQPSFPPKGRFVARLALRAAEVDSRLLALVLPAATFGSATLSMVVLTVHGRCVQRRLVPRRCVGRVFVIRGWGPLAGPAGADMRRSSAPACLPPQTWGA